MDPGSLADPVRQGGGEQRVVLGERARHGEAGGVRVFARQLVAVVGGDLLRGADRNRAAGHQLALGDQEGVQLELGREEAEVRRHRLPVQHVLTGHRPVQPDPPGMPVGDLLEVRVADRADHAVAAGRDGAADDEVDVRVGGEHRVDRPEELDLALVVHRETGHVVEGRQGRVQPEGGEHLRAVGLGRVAGQPAVGDGAAADELALRRVLDDPRDGQAPEGPLERGVPEGGVEVQLAGGEEVQQVAVGGDQGEVADAVPGRAVGQVGARQLGGHRVGQRAGDRRVGERVEARLGGEQLQQPLQLRPVDLLVDRHVAGQRTDHQEARVGAQHRRQQVVVVRFVGLHHGRLAAEVEVVAQEAQAGDLEHQGLEEGQVVALTGAGRVDPLGQQVEVLVGQEVDVHALVPQPVGAGGEVQSELGGVPGPDVLVQHQRHGVPVGVVQLLQVVVLPEVVEAAVRRGDHGDAVALVGELAGQVPHQ